MELVAENKNVIILGDFNIHINNPNDADANIIIDTLEVLGFQQHIDFSTHQQRNTLDPVFTKILNNIRVGKGEEGSDHVMVTRTSVKRDYIKTKETETRRNKL